MKGLESSNSAGLFIEIGQGSLHAACGDDAFAFPLERGPNGRLTDLCRERLTLSLRGFVSAKGRPYQRTAFCAIGARGVSMRRLTLPASSDEELQRVLRLQIESEFPVSPDELAWGSRPIGPAKSQGNGSPARQELLVVAVKKEVLEEYSGIMAACGINPAFTLAALARAELHPAPTGSCAVLDIGRTHSELMCFENGAQTSIRILPWGGEAITRSIQEKLSVSHDDAEKIKMSSSQALGEQGALLQSAMESALASLARILATAKLGDRLYLTGKSASDPRTANLLTGLLSGVICQSLEQPPGTGRSAAIAGLKKSGGRNALILTSNGGQGAAKIARPAVWKWAAAAAALLLAALLFPYAEAIVFKPFLEKKLAALEADRGRLATIDEELDFLKFLKQNQPPYLETIYLLARSSPGGTRLEELNIGRHREINLRLKMGGSQQVSDFRSRLIDSGWFANVVVEEQAPSPDRRFAVRMTAELKPAESRKPITAEPPGWKKDYPPQMGADTIFPAMPQAPVVAAMPAGPPPPNVMPAPMPGAPNNAAPAPPKRRVRIAQPPQP